MIFEIIKRSIIGIAFGGIFTFIALTILKFGEINASVSEIWINMLGSLFIGIYFGLSSFILEMESFSPLKKTVIHFSVSLLFYLGIAIPIGWVPFTTAYILLGILLFILSYSIFWAGAQIYAKKMEASMNAYLQRKK